ncbi:hypothetical protein FIBSPDRAFT_502421 [Athelia psychrophila]|uniref:Uncharacterized protein n=1 Tax=Athelia psychrophila TaxID=1759441 RepID=A0A167V796_9AGAM|nr:hypothetical protein FIBSPDRAFT_385731 [Fibularhizoctonia sp. CBS 109695]KZP21513.1 hypothetical protein FIBSPDRAFT_502421 [Fibularhizoctonia sp. CBS 109695]
MQYSLSSTIALPQPLARPSATPTPRAPGWHAKFLCPGESFSRSPPPPQRAPLPRLANRTQGPTGPSTTRRAHPGVLALSHPPAWQIVPRVLPGPRRCAVRVQGLDQPPPAPYRQPSD